VTFILIKGVSSTHRHVISYILYQYKKRNTQRKPPTCHKSQTNFIAQSCIEYTSPWRESIFSDDTDAISYDCGHGAPPFLVQLYQVFVELLLIIIMMMTRKFNLTLRGEGLWKTTDASQVTYKLLSHNVVSSTPRLCGIRTHDVSFKA
jgi:hypothetical protein